MGVKTVIRHPESLNKLEATGQYEVEKKLDGIWCSIHTNNEGVIDKIISRHGKTKTTKGFNKFLGRDLVLKDTILIGELITKKAELHIFDIVKLLGHIVSTLDNERRRSILEKLHIYVEGITLVSRFKDKFLEHFNEIIKAGGEGLVVKKIGKGTHYIPNSRTADWMKLKKAMTMDYVIMGYDISTSKSHTDMIKNIHLGLYKNGKLEKVGLVGSMKMKEREFFTKEGHKLIGKVVEVGGNEVFPSGAMRHPYFIKMRSDLTRHDANIEKVEIKEDAYQHYPVTKIDNLETIKEVIKRNITNLSGIWIIVRDNLKYLSKQDKLEIAELVKKHYNREKLSRPLIGNWNYDNIMEMLVPIETAQENISKIKSSATKLPNKPLRLKESFKLTPNQEVAADKAVKRADEILARGEKEGFSQELFKELATQCLIGQVSYPVMSESRYRWKNFNTQQAENVLNKIKSTDPIFKNIPREWIRMLLRRFKESIGRGIKDTEKNIKKIKSSATKFPNKPLRLKEWLMNDWAIGDEQFYEPQYGDGRISKDTFDKMPRKKKKKTLAKKIYEMWATGTDRLYGNNKLSDPDNKTGSYEIDDIIQPSHKLKKKKGKKIKLPHQGIEYPPKFYFEGWAAGSDRNSGKRYKSDEEDDMDEFEKLARDTYYDANAAAYSKRKKKRKKIIKENYDKESLVRIAKAMFSDILDTSISNLKTWIQEYVKDINEEDLGFLLNEMRRLEKEKFPNPVTGGFHVRNIIAEISKIFKSKSLKLESILNELKGLNEEVTLHKIKKLYTEIKEILKPIISKIELVGSASRLHDVVNDLDIVAIPKRDIKTYLEEKGIQATSGAEKVINFKYKGTPINIWVTDKTSWGSSVLHFSSGKGIIQLKQKAIQMGLKLNRYGLFKGDRKIAGENYDEILKILGTETKFSKIKLLEKVVENSEEVERFIKEGQFPRLGTSGKYWRFRQIDPKKFDIESFRTIKSSNGNARIIGKIKGKIKVQSILIGKDKLLEKDIQDYLKLVIR
jgi:hypothetical protein